MSKHRIAGASNGNNLLARLLQPEYEQLLTRMRLVPLRFNETLYEYRGKIEYVYFPLRGVLSFITLMTDGRGIEVATIGNEGMLGLPAFIEAGTSPLRVICQAAGEALRMSVREMQAELMEFKELRRLLVLYQSAFIAQVSQSVACNGLHPVMTRCCRWLLMTHDRLDSDKLPLTHEFLSMMLGVRRSSVTEVLHPLQARGLIKCGRGTIEVINRKGLEKNCCECYQIVNDEFKRVLG